MANTFKLKTKANVGVTTVGIYTAPAATTTVVIGITLSNTSGSAYSAKGKALTSVTPALSTDTACCDFADVSWTSASFTANGCLIFNDSHSSDAAVCAIAFGGDKTVSSGTFTIQFPTADASNAILRIA